MPTDKLKPRSAGGRPKGDPALRRNETIGVRVSATEYAALRTKAAMMHMPLAQWLREAALTRNLPSPPVAPINREQYAELARLSANLNQLARLANEGDRVTVDDGLLNAWQPKPAACVSRSLASKDTTMIAKAIKGKGFRGALEYDLKKEQGRIIDTNMDGRGPRELAAEFGEIRKLRPNLGKAVLHVSLAASPGEHLTDGQWVKIGQYYINGMGLDQNQYVMSRHTDTEHEQIHMVVNRIQFDGKVTSDSHDYRRQEFLMRELERDLGLRQIESSTKTERRAATKGEIEEALRTGKPSTCQQLQQLCDAAASDCDTFTLYAERLNAAGVDLVPVTQLDGTKMSGLSYRLDGVMMKGSDLGKRYSPAGLAKHGVSYVKERDYEAVGRGLEHSAPDRIGAGDRDVTDSENSQRGPLGVDAGTTGAGDGGADGRNARDHGSDRAARPGAGRPTEDADRNGIERLKQCVVRSAAGSAEPGSGDPTNGMAPVHVSGNDRVDNGAARERILALAGATYGAEPPRRQGSGGSAAPRDRTREAVQRQIAAMGRTATKSSSSMRRRASKRSGNGASPN
jgi:hypothetical protein